MDITLIYYAVGIAASISGGALWILKREFASKAELLAMKLSVEHKIALLDARHTESNLTIKIFQKTVERLDESISKLSHCVISVDKKLAVLEALHDKEVGGA